jgi:ABC-type multidrug transport system fused ATPase/permease subunit
MTALLTQLRQQLFADFSRIFRVLPRHLRRRTLGVFALVFLLGVVEVCTVLAISFLAMSIASPEQLQNMGILVRVTRILPVFAAVREDPRLLALAGSMMVTLFIAAKNGLGCLVSRRTTLLGEAIALFCGEVTFRRYLYSPYLAHLSGSSAAMFRALSWRIMLGTMMVQLMSVYTYAVISVFLLTMLVAATPAVLLMLIVLLAVSCSLIYRGIRGALDRSGTDMAAFAGLESLAIMNAMHGIREVLIYRQQPVFYERFREACVGGVPARAFLAMAPLIPTWVLETAGFVALPATLYVMYAVQDASMTRITGVLTMIMLVSWRVLPLMNRSLSALVTVRGCRAGALECLQGVEQALADPAPEPVEPAADFVIGDSIAFSEVGFTYPKATQECLHGVSFTIPRGARVGVVGRSGAGKSSLATLLSGLAPPSAGRILVDGRELSAAEHAAYVSQVGYVAQAPYIMAGTLAENVAFSQWGKPYDEARVREACRMAALDIAETRGITMPIGENGAGLSGGQAQRLSIARALYASPSLLILDEATSSLDIGVEAAIMRTLLALPQSITMVIIAHRLSTVEHCNLLLWLDNGVVREFGAPETVLQHYQAELTDE